VIGGRRPSAQDRIAASAPLRARHLRFGSRSGPPALVLSKRPAERRPTVVYFSGMHSTKEQTFPVRADNSNDVCPHFVGAMLDAGLHVVVVDTQGHGERTTDGRSPEAWLHDGFAGTGPDPLVAIRKEAAVVVNGVLDLGIVADDDISVVGQSWGGLHALLTMAGDTRLQRGVAIIPVVDVRDLDPFADLPSGGFLEQTLPGLRDGPAIAPRPLLLLAGAEDQVAPSWRVARLGEELRASYGAGMDERLQVEILPGVGHHFHPRQLERCLMWLFWDPSEKPGATGVQPQ